MINTEYHFPGHQQALIKNNICIAVLTFALHDNYEMENTFLNFEYDLVVNLCSHKKDAILGSIWNGEDFIEKPAESWTAGENLAWIPPVEKPGENYIWQEENMSWAEHVEETA